MKTKKEIQAKIDEIEADTRMGYKPAKVDINAPLALIQCSLGSQRDILKWVLNESTDTNNRN